MNPQPVMKLLTTTFLGMNLMALIGCVSPKTNLNSGPGPEDLVEISGRGHPTMVVTGTIKHRLICKKTNGCLEIYRPGVDEKFLTAFQGSKKLPYSSSGIAYVENSRDAKWAGMDLLYANNGANDSVEVFQITGGTFTHLASLKGISQETETNKQESQANGIAAFSDGSVYVTKMAFLPKPGNRPQLNENDQVKFIGNSVAAYTPPQGGGEGGTWKTVLTGLNGANGIAPGPGERSLLVCSYLGKEIWSFPRSPKTRKLSNSAEPLLKLDFHPDNLKRTAEGTYECCGQKYLLPAAIQLLTSAPVSPGKWHSIRWDGKTLTSVDRTPLIRNCWQSPSTAIIVGDRFYVGNPVARNVSTGSVPSSQP